MIEFYRVENIKSITIFNSIVNALGRMDIPLTDRKVRRYDGQGLINLENLGSFQYWPKWAFFFFFFFEKREPKISAPPTQSFF